MNCREAEPWATEPGLELDWLHAHDPQWITLHNRLHRHRDTWQGNFAGQTISVRWSGTAPPLEPVFDIHLAFGNTTLVLQLPMPALELAGLADHGVGDLKGLAGSMLLEHGLLGLIEPLEHLTGYSLRVMETSGAAESTSEPAVLSLMLEVQIAQGSALSVPLQLNADAASLIADLLDQHAAPASQSLSALRLPLTVEGGEAPLSLAELRSLRPGDVLMLDDCPDAQVRLVLDHRLQARAELNGDTLKLLEQPTAINFSKEHSMTETAVGPSLDATLDELPLTVVCQVGSVELSLAQLRELGAGSLLPLAPRLHDGVDLMVNGRRVGQGQLVKIGDGLGVRLLSFASA